MERLLAVLAIVLGATACTPPPTETHTPGDRVLALKTRAASDLSCPAEHVATSSIDQRTMTASGCGRSATYDERCEACSEGFQSMPSSQPCNCSWVQR